MGATTAGDRFRLAYRVAAVLAAVGVLAVVALPSGSPGAVAVSLTIEITAAVVFVVVAIGMPRRARLVWRLLAVYLVMVTAGDIVYDVMTYHLGITPFPSWPDLLYYAAYIPQALALIVIVAHRQRVWDLQAWIDTGVIVIGAVAIGATVVLRPMVEAATDATAVAAVAYPVLDLAIFALLVRVVVGGGRPMLPLVLLTVSVAVSLLADLIYNALAVSDGFDSDQTWLDAMFVAGPVLMAFAITAPGASRITRPVLDDAKMMSPPRMIGLGLGALVGPVLIAWQSVHDATLDTLLLAAATIVVNALIVWRILLLLGTVRRQADQLDTLARTDALTGLPNRRSWDFTLLRTATAVGTTGGRVVVAVADLDHFKAFNDEHGHIAGDHLLRECSAAWRAVLPADAMLARYGGEEFAILLPDATLDEAMLLLQRMRRATPAPATVSVGMASAAVGEDLAHVFDRADAALYRAKADGRDRVVVDESDVTAT